MRYPIVLALLIAGSAQASSLEQFKAFFSGTQSARARFEQKVHDRGGKVVQEVKGSFVFQRPGRFRWTYDKPADQVIVGDGQRISIYVGRKATARVTQIPDGNFGVYFASGVSWDGKRNTFTRNCGFTKFDRKMKFTSGGGRVGPGTYTVRLVANGRTTSASIDVAADPNR